jgi:alpha-L-fucosidase 2
MLEALVQSRWMPDGAEIELLPALPAQWAEGSLEGIRVRGGADIDVRWKAAKIVSMELRARSDGAFRWIPPAGQSVAEIRTPDGKALAVRDGVLAAKAGTIYRIAFR